MNTPAIAEKDKDDKVSRAYDRCMVKPQKCGIFLVDDEEETNKVGEEGDG